MTSQIPDPDEFNVADREPAPPIGGRVEVISRLSEPRVVRLLLGLPVVLIAMGLNAWIVGQCVLGHISAEDAAKVVTLMSGPNALAGAVVGFFFASTVGKR